MSTITERVTEQSDPFDWKIQPIAARWVTRALDALIARNPLIAKLAYELREFTGTRLVDWVDHIALSDADSLGLIGELVDVGYHPTQNDNETRSWIRKNPDADKPDSCESSYQTNGVWQHTLGMFPTVIVNGGRTGLALRCDCAEAALVVLPPALGIPRLDQELIIGPRGGMLRHFVLDERVEAELWIVERHGCTAFGCATNSLQEIAAAARHLEIFRNRPRAFDELATAFEATNQLFKAAADEIGTDWACDQFFIAEREYWQGRNHAGDVQYHRQNRLGLGWANHDHHTYRSSRAAFPHLINTLELMGFQCRERFYAGREAGWGAQVIEQPNARVVIFADVDLSPEEVANDFAHSPLAARDKFGTVGLWCELHGEAFLEAGMHHLECQFDFDAARDQLAKDGVETMAPFTYFPHLKQAFTKGEVWPVDQRRLANLCRGGHITPEQSDRFRHEGALGSHMEILERNDGYKGFNQTGISEIITRTDPRTNAGK